MKRSAIRPALQAVLAVHVAVDLALLAWPWQLMSGTPAVVIAWPLSQISLVAIWAAFSRMPSALRFAGCLSASASAWLLLIVVLPNMSVYDRQAAGWGAACATQAATTVLVTAAVRWASRKQSRGKAPAGTAAGRFQFSIGFLLLWTAAVALLLGLCRAAVTQLGWTEEVLDWLYFLFMPVFGAGNAAVAGVVLVSLGGRRWLLARMATSLIVASLVGYVQPCLLEWFFKSAGGLTRANAATLAVVQGAYLYGTLLPLRRIAPFRTDATNTPKTAEGPTGCLHSDPLRRNERQGHCP
jgi:hypothetical protein